MANVLSYNLLVEKIQTYTKRSDPTFITQIPFFIMLGQQKLARDMKVVGVKQTITGNLITNNQLLAKPSNWLNTSSFYLKSNNLPYNPNFNIMKPLLHRSYDFCQLYSPDITFLGLPKYFDDSVDYFNFLLFPTPDQDYTYQLTSFILPDLIDEIIQTNYFTRYAPNALLDICLVEAYLFIKDMDSVQMWTQTYQSDLESLNKEDKQRVVDGFAVRGL